MRVDDLIGLPYRKGGRGPEAYDCAGLVVEVMRRRGIELAIPETPAEDGDQYVAMRQILSAEWIPKEQPHVGCVAFFKPGHVAVMLSRYAFLHTAEDVGQVCIERLDGPLWQRRFAGFYEYGGPKR